MVDEKDQDPNEHSQMMYDAESFREEEDCDDELQQYDQGYANNQYGEEGEWQDEEGEEDYIESLPDGYHQEQFESYEQFSYPNENGDYHSERMDTEDEINNPNGQYFDEYSQANDEVKNYHQNELR